MGGECDITEYDLGDNIRHNKEDSGGDPRLNKEQEIKSAFIIAKRMRIRMGLSPLTAAGINGGGT